MLFEKLLDSSWRDLSLYGNRPGDQARDEDNYPAEKNDWMQEATLC